MKRWRWIAGGLLCCAGIVHADIPATQPDAAGLMVDVRRAEDWLDQVQSFRVKMKQRTTTSMLLVQSRVKAARKLDPDVDVSARPDLSVESSGTLEIAYAPQRGRMTLAYVDGPTFTIAWDGKREVTRLQMKDNEQYFVRPKPNSLLERMTGDLYFGKMEPHPYWWVSPARLENLKRGLPKPEMFKYAGRGDFRGVDCYAVSLGLVNWYIGAADHRFYGRVRYELPSGSEHEAEARIIAVAQKYGAQITRLKEWNAWHDMLPAEKQTEVDAAYEEAVRSLCRPKEEMWCQNYQPLGPGRVYPLAQGTALRNYESETDAELERTDYTVTEIEINPKLDESMFVITVPPGAAVRDDTVSPPKIYKPATKPSK